MTGARTRGAGDGQSERDHALHYESLRAGVVERRSPSHRGGLVVLVRQGVAAWMEAWSRLPASHAAPAPIGHERCLRWPDDASVEVVRILTSMALSHIEERRA